MKKIIYSLLILVAASVSVNAQKLCCPVFDLRQNLAVCDTGYRSSPGGGTIQGDKCYFLACNNSTLSYNVYPIMAGFTYTWQVTGGTPATFTGNPMAVTWGGGTNGKIKVFVSNADGSCKDTVIKEFCLVKSPKAVFTPSGTSICLNSVVQFTNTSVGAMQYYWDFGDGNTSAQINPSHIFTTPGVYNVVLTVSATSGSSPGPQAETNCGCKDTASFIVTVKNESGINIISGCKQMLCAGDTADYCTINNCSSYNWSVTGGNIIGAATGKCIRVIWNGTYPATVNLSGNCGGSCGNTGSLNVPVLYPTMPITGNTIVCPGSNASYSLPAMPGTFYNWSISPAGGGSIAGPDKNVSAINVLWTGTSGTYTITCNYQNPATKCSGTGTIQVTIKPPYKITGNVKFCVGDPFVYTASAAGNWSITPAIGFSPSTFPAGASISGTWNAPGNYLVSATPLVTSNFCSYPDTKNVIVNDRPKLGAIIGPILICPGATSVYSVLSNLEGMFNWSASVGMSSYAVMGSQADSVSITWNAIGPYKVVVSQISSEGCSSSPKTISVTPYAAPTITGSNTACLDTKLTYTATGTAPPGGFVWTLSNALGTISTGQGTNMIDVLWHGSSNPANNTSTLTLTTCGGTASMLVTIALPPAFTITGVNPLCTPAGKTLTGSLAGTYTWFLNGNPTAFNTQSINVAAHGIYMAEVLLPSGCKAKAYFTVTPEQVPNASISTTGKIIYECTETVSTLLTAVPVGAGYCYQWFTSSSRSITGSPISGATTSSYTATTAAYFWCEVRFCGTGCIASSDTIFLKKKICAPGCTIPPPNIKVTVSPCNPFTFTAILSPSSPAGTVTWTWNDGTNSSGFTAIHQYKFIGTFPVCVTWAYAVMGACSKDSCFKVTVPLAANFTAASNCGMVTFTNLSQSVTPGYTSSWNFPGGTPSTSSLQNPPAISYTGSGLQTASLTVTKDGCSVTYSDTFTVHNPVVTINISSPVCAFTNAPFTATGGNTNWQCNWNFGDGFISNLQNPTHAYAEVLVPASYTVSLTVTDEFGCTFTASKPISVLPSLKPNIGTDKFICAGDSVKLFLTSGSYSSYQWYKDGVLIPGATASFYCVLLAGEYWVEVSNGTGCMAKSNHTKVKYNSSPVAKILKVKVQCYKTFSLQNTLNQIGCNYTWSSIPSGITMPVNNGTNAASFANFTVPAAGNYQIALSVTNASGCVAKDTICVTVAESVTVSVISPAGPLCEGTKYVFTSSASPIGSYFYQWSNNVTGTTMSTGLPGMYQVTATSNQGCFASAFTMNISKRPNVSLFPVGCDTLCLTDTVHIPLPNNSGAYNIQWYDSGVPVGTNSINLVLANIGPGDHHFYAAVSFPGGCSDTTGSFDLFVKDCTLPAPCNNCSIMFDNAKFVLGTVVGNIMNGTFTFTSTKPLKEVRINVADLKYRWNDPTCKNCKAEISDRTCIFPANITQQIGGLVWNNFTGSSVPPSASTTDCPKELIFKPGAVLPPGTYNIPLQVSFTAAKNNNCKLVIDQFCMHIAVTDEECRVCEKNICSNLNVNNTDSTSCDCAVGNNWANLYLTPTKIGAPKPKTLIFCNSSITGYNFNTPYLLSGMYNCKPGCTVKKTEVVIRNQTGDIIYTHIGAALYETVVFPVKGIYTVTLTAWCGDKKCECKFQIAVDTGGETENPPITSTDPPKTDTPTKETIDQVLKDILLPDFSGGVLIAKKDSILYEKYQGSKVNNRTAFDLASVTKTFTAMAVLKLSEEKKINLTDDVTKYIADFPFTGISIKMLLSHTSGLEDYVKFMQSPEVDKSINYSNTDLLNFIIKNKEKVKIANAPAPFNYSNTNFAMLALVIEKVSNQNYGDYLSYKFFKPLGMNDTYVFDGGNAKNATPSYYKNGKVYDIKFLDFIYGDKNVYSTVKDMMKWDKALREGKIFKNETLALAYTPGSKLIADQSNYGLGWRILLVPNGKKIIYHNGWWHGNRSVFIRLLDEDALIVILSNSSFTTISNSRKLADLFGQYKQTGKNIVNF